MVVFHSPSTATKEIFLSLYQRHFAKAKQPMAIRIIMCISIYIMITIRLSFSKKLQIICVSICPKSSRYGYVNAMLWMNFPKSHNKRRAKARFFTLNSNRHQTRWYRHLTLPANVNKDFLAQLYCDTAEQFDDE